MARKRYLFFDIDGTLLAGGYGQDYLPESAALALQKLRDAGHFLCLATGRAQAMAVDRMQSMGFENMVSDGGYGVTLNDELWGITPLPREKVIKLIRECEEVKARADYITTDVADDGIYKACEALGLFEPVDE